MPNKATVSYTYDYDEPFVLAVLRKAYAYIVYDNNPSSGLADELSERSDEILDMYISGDLKFSYSANMEYRIVETVDSSSTGIIQVSGKYTGESRIQRIEIVVGGAVGTATWKFRIDDDESFGSTLTTSRQEYAIMGGLWVAFGDGTFVAGDKWDIYCSGDKVSSGSRIYNIQATR
jgi:hypothetical protein